MPQEPPDKANVGAGRHGHSNCRWRSGQNLWQHSVVVPSPGPFVFERGPVSVFEREENMVGGEMPGIMVLCKGGVSARNMFAVRMNQPLHFWKPSNGEDDKSLLKKCQKTKYSFDLAQGHKYGAPSEDQTYYTVVIGLQDLFVNHYINNILIAKHVYLIFKFITYDLLSSVSSSTQHQVAYNTHCY